MPEDPQALVSTPAPRDFRSKVQKLQSREAGKIMKHLAALVVDQEEFEKLRKSKDLTALEFLQVEGLYQLLFVKWSWSGYKEMMDRMCGKVPLVVTKKFQKDVLDLDEMSDEELNALDEEHKTSGS